MIFQKANMPNCIVLGCVSMLIICITRCSGLKCFECSDRFKPADCGLITHCPADTKCYVDEVVSGDGRIVYNTGCRPSQQCHFKRDVLAPVGLLDQADYPAKRADLKACSICCDGEFCNNHGCNSQVAQKPYRGPYCYNCHAQGGRTTCRTVKQCDLAEVCSLQNTTTPGIYKSGCISPQQCHAIEDLYQASGLVGKRSTILTMPLCCREDFCNDHAGMRLGGHVLPGTNVNGGWSPWSLWSNCPATCGVNGTKHRFRNCDNPAPAGNGTNCVGHDRESIACVVSPCPVNGGWSLWSLWSNCPATCGVNGTKRRFRNCDNPAPAANGTNCVGHDRENIACVVSPCPVNGGWSQWSLWAGCTTTCGSNGTKHRFRNCDNPAPSWNGTSCIGSDRENLVCVLPPCPVDGSWSSWSGWSGCSATCGTNRTQHRTRTCNNPAPVGNGANCVGDAMDVNNCTAFPCPVDGQWSDWSVWTSCTVTCGSGGKHMRDRTCDNPAPQNNGADCTGNRRDVTDCSVKLSCTGQWSSWSGWSSCSKTCGGEKIRTRTCNKPSNTAPDCLGDSIQFHQCHPVSCSGSLGHHHGHT